jgi:hypothetical protein
MREPFYYVAKKRNTSVPDNSNMIINLALKHFSQNN